MRRKFYADKDGHWVEEKPRYEAGGVMVIPDIQPYQSMITGELITSRSKHREHLKEHGCVEVGNDYHGQLKAYDNLPDVAPQQRHEILRAQMDAIPHDEFNRMKKRDLERIRWQTRN